MSVCRNCGSQAPEPLSPTLHGGHLSPRERRAALAKVRARILLHQKHIDALKKEEAELKAGLALVTYPVLALPAEITSSIFLHCLPSHGRVIPSRSSAPLLLAQICSQWREVALSTGELWSSSYPSHRFIHATAMVSHPLHALIRTWFSRAKAAPLSLGLNCRYILVSLALMEVVSSFAGQIQRLDLQLDSDQFRQYRPFQTRFPVLQHLTTNSSEAEMGDFLKDTPSLRELCIDNDNNWTSFNFPLPLLNRLELSIAISIDTFLDVLNNFPVLSHFKYNLWEPDTDEVDGSMVPVFPHLSSLVGSATALCFIILPGLRELELTRCSHQYHVQQFLARSSCTVERLTVNLRGYGKGDDDREHLCIWLKAFPSLSVLHIGAYDSLDITLDCLDSGSLAPRLSEITIDSRITSSNINNDYDDALVSLLRRRTNPRRPFKLRKFHILFSFDLDEDYERYPGDFAESALNDMSADGLDFLLRYKSDLCGTWTWPHAYIDLTDPLPFLP
ncbi:hypothetical protein C8J57DRAFT_138139 [Mycena rebaudengoi]|nr:hypothetical protein C8J57DRAFT_138139 [Mycena rebaudengoi]